MLSQVYAEAIKDLKMVSMDKDGSDDEEEEEEEAPKAASGLWTVGDCKLPVRGQPGDRNKDCPPSCVAARKVFPLSYLSHPRPHRSFHGRPQRSPAR